MEEWISGESSLTAEDVKAADVRFSKIDDFVESKNNQIKQKESENRKNAEEYEAMITEKSNEITLMNEKYQLLLEKNEQRSENKKTRRGTRKAK